MQKSKTIRLLILLTLFVTFYFKSFSQVLPTPATYSSSVNISYFRTWEASSPQTNEDTLISRGTKDVRQITQYVDGLGRLIQSVAKKGSLITGGSGIDMVIPTVYDEFGRERYQYLPFAANSTGGNSSISDGNFKLNPFQQDSAFNRSQFSGENYYYAQINFETSPLSRPLESFAPGDNWVGTYSQSSESNRHSVKIKHYLNTVSDSVRVWNVLDSTNRFGSYSSSARYAAGTLIKTITLDESNNQLVEFEDKGGKLILKKVQLTASSDTGTGNGHVGWLCTYYIYDDLGQLRCVTQPKGTDLVMSNGWAFTGDILKELCFRYEYDYRLRMIMKKNPGAGTVYMIYDKRDRSVMTQDSNMRAGHQWMYLQYDNLNRPILSGLLIDGTNYNNAAYHCSHADTSASYPNTGDYTVDILTKTFYDDYSWRSAESNPLSSTRNTSYDGYLLSASNTTWPYPQASTQTSSIKGMVSGTKTRILGTSTYLYSIPFYDDHGRTIQAQSTNSSGGTDIANAQYGFTGQPLINLVKHEKSGNNSQTSIILSKFTYDDLNRLAKLEKKISNTNVNGAAMPSSWTTTIQNAYDALGQLKTKRVGNTLDSLKYDYNIRGWLTSMNKEFINDSISGHWFGFELGYDKTSSSISGTSFINPQFDGNISGMIWRQGSDKEIRKYDYKYDNLKRVVKADFNQKFGSVWAKTDPNNSNLNIDYSLDTTTYDANGNILRMKQHALQLSTSEFIDKLSYSYMNGGESNRLSSVSEDDGYSEFMIDNFKDRNSSDDDYSYDGNGNLLSDKEKRIDSIYYNLLNLPQKIRVSNEDNSLKGLIEYKYDALGNKVQKKTTEGSTITTTDYIDGFVYQNDTLQFASHEEGRIRFAKKYFLSGDSANEIFFDYFLKDHLQNVRAVLTEQKDTAKYIATFENDIRAKENNLFYNIEQTAVPYSVTDCPQTNLTSPDDYTSVLDGDNHKVGAAITLKVMAGDKIDLGVNYWYPSYSQVKTENPLSTGDLLDIILNRFSDGVIGLTNKASQGDLSASGPLFDGVASFLSSQDNEDDFPGYPKAFLNWIMLDDQFKYQPSSSGFVKVERYDDAIRTLASLDITVGKSGYLFVYLSNETSGEKVFFDNLVVQHYTGPLTEISDYTPWGLTMKMLESKSFGKQENKFQMYNGYEKNEDLDLGFYESFYRIHDPQIGRFWQIDPKPTDMEGLYNAMGNNPIKNIDFLGDTTIFYNSSGVELLRTNENNDALGNAVTFIKDDHLKEFNNWVAEFKSNGSDFTEACGIKLLRDFGESYNIKSVFNYVDGNAKNATSDKSFSPIDGKGPLINEASAAVEIKNGAWTVDPAKTEPHNNSPFSCGKAQNSKVNGITLHTHDNEGRRFRRNSDGRTGTVSSGASSAGEDNSSLTPGTGLFEMAAGKKAIYFYNSSGVILTVNRDAFDPKYFKKK